MTAKKIMTGTAIAFAIVVIAAVVGKAFVLPALSAGHGGDEPAAPTAVEEAAASVKLDDEDKARAQSYTGATLELAELLEANTWIEPGGATLVFGKGYYVLTEPDGSTSAGAAILGTPNEDTQGSGDKTAKTRACPVSTSAGPQMLTVEESKSKERELVAVTFTALGANRSFERGDPSREITVEKPDNTLVSLLGGDESFDAIAGQIAVHVATHYPSADVANWTGKTQVDYLQRNLTLEYRLDDRSNSRLKATVPIGGGECEFSAG